MLNFAKLAVHRVRLMSPDAARDLVDEFRPAGDVLELACATGIFTGQIARHARSVTAVDALPRMLDINRSRVDDPRVGYVCADIFAWEPDRAYDTVFFGFWLSHVPPAVLDYFWNLVGTCVAPGGRVAFVDEDDRGAANEHESSTGGVPAARRTLADGPGVRDREGVSGDRMIWTTGSGRSHGT